MKSLIILLQLLIFTQIYSQTIRPYFVVNIFCIPQGFGIERLNSNGTSGILNNVSNISGINPASINQFKHLSFGLSYQFQSEIPDAYPFGMDLSRAYSYMPQSLGGVYRFNNFCFGLGAGQKYNGNIEFESDLMIGLVDSINFVDGSTSSFRYKQMLQYYSLTGSYTFNNLLSDNSGLTIGLRYNLNRFSESDESDSFIQTAILWGSSFEAGLLYNYNLGLESNINLGLSYLTQLEMDGHFETESDMTSIDPPRGPTFYYLGQTIAKVKLPAELNIDLVIHPVTSFKLTGSVKNVFWNQINSNIKNQPDYSFNGIYSFSNSINASLGFYHSGWTFITDILYLNDKMAASFITAGLSFNIQKVTADIAAADSHLFSGDKRKQTIGKIGFTVQL